MKSCKQTYKPHNKCRVVSLFMRADTGSSHAGKFVKKCLTTSTSQTETSCEAHLSVCEDTLQVVHSPQRGENMCMWVKNMSEIRSQSCLSNNRSINLGVLSWQSERKAVPPPSAAVTQILTAFREAEQTEEELHEEWKQHRSASSHFLQAVCIKIRNTASAFCFKRS